jgi:hypothetical protein
VNVVWQCLFHLVLSVRKVTRRCEEGKQAGASRDSGGQVSPTEWHSAGTGWAQPRHMRGNRTEEGVTVPLRSRLSAEQQRGTVLGGLETRSRGPSRCPVQRARQEQRFTVFHLLRKSYKLKTRQGTRQAARHVKCT